MDKVVGKFTSVREATEKEKTEYTKPRVIVEDDKKVDTRKTQNRMEYYGKH